MGRCGTRDGESSAPTYTPAEDILYTSSLLVPTCASLHFNTTDGMSGWGRDVLSRNSFQTGQPGGTRVQISGHKACTAIIRPTPPSQDVFPAGKGSGHDMTGLDISHGQFPESAPQYPVSRLHHQVWGQWAAVLPTWPCPLRRGGRRDGSGEHGHVRLWRERTGGGWTERLAL